jgi:hypothetical protein
MTKTQEAPAGTAAPEGGKVKDRRSKAQIKADENAAQTRRLLEYWLQLKRFLLLAFSAERITPDAEQQFLEMMSALQKAQRACLQTVPADIDFGGQRMVQLLRGIISVAQCRGLPDTDKKNRLPPPDPDQGRSRAVEHSEQQERQGSRPIS